MIKLLRGQEFIYISLEDYVNQYHVELNLAWNEYLELINEGMNVKNDVDYENYLKKLNLKKYDFEKVNKTHKDLKKSEYSNIFDDEILKFLSHLYELGYFNRIENPDLKKWLATKNIFQQNREKIPINEGFSIMDLIPLKNGTNAIKNTLLFALKC